MKVLHLISSAGFFGAENVVILLAKSQIEAGLSVYIGVFRNLNNPNLEIVEAARANNIPVKIFDCRARFDLRTAKAIKNFIKEERIGLLHTHGYKANFFVLFAGDNIKKVCTCHLWKGRSPKMRFYKILDKLLLRKFDAVITVSQDLKEEVIKSGINIDKVKLVLNGIDLPRFKDISPSPFLKDSLGIAKESSIIGTVGILSEEKGHSYLLEAASEVLKEFPESKFLLIGDGPSRDSLASKAKSMGIENNVLFTCRRNDIPELLGIMDIFVMPSLMEGMPMALLEAMAAGKPIVATKVGGIPGMITDGFSGLLVEPKDPVGLADSISRLLGNKSLADILAKNAYQKAVSEYSSRKMADEYMKVYEGLAR